MHAQSFQPSLALNDAQAPPEPRAALCLALPPETDGAVPEWIELIPAGGRVQGEDGRWWTNPDAQAVVAATKLPIPLDWEHATELRAPKGEPSPAAGWIEALEASEGGAIRGRVTWTPAGHYSVRSREYRFVSPVFLFDQNSKRILRLLNAALTNRPNLPLAALNAADDPSPSPQSETTMDEKLLAALGLAKDATEDQALNAVQKLKDERQAALNQAQTLRQAQGELPSLDKFVPRADYDVAMNRATAAEKALGERDQAEHKAKAEAAVNAAVEAGKITPATKEFYLATCQTKEGLESFQKFAAAAPVIAGETGLAGKKPEGDKGAGKLSAEQLAVCQRMGLVPEEYAKALA